jgi:prepilin-type processing-associated H-X9-DG protein
VLIVQITCVNVVWRCTFTMMVINSCPPWAVGSEIQLIEWEERSLLFRLAPISKLALLTCGLLAHRHRHRVTFVCPSRRPSRATLPFDDEYGKYDGGGWAWSKTDFAGNPRVLSRRGKTRQLSEITDGLSTTICLGEKALASKLAQRQSWYYDEPFLFGNSFGTVRTGVQVVRDAPWSEFQNNWGAAHPNAASFMFADGSVRRISYSVRSATLLAFLTPAAGDMPVQDE